jgi:hypothetical protein
MSEQKSGVSEQKPPGTKPPISTTNASAARNTHLTVFDIGKHKRKAVKSLRRGEGKLVDLIKGSVEELQASGADISGPIVFICERKSKSRLALW